MLTIHALRQISVNVAEGIAGIQYGAKPALVDDIHLNDLRQVAREWLAVVFNTFAAEISVREAFLIGASPVLAAIGALGNRIFHAPTYDRQHVLEEQLDSIRSVDWRKSERWAGIAGKLTPKGLFSVSGTKEVGYAIYNVLADRDNPNYGRVWQVSPPLLIAEPGGFESAIPTMPDQGRRRCFNVVTAAYEAAGCQVIGIRQPGTDIDNSRTIASLMWHLDHGRWGWTTLADGEVMQVSRTQGSRVSLLVGAHISMFELSRAGGAAVGEAAARVDRVELLRCLTAVGGLPMELDDSQSYANEERLVGVSIRISSALVL